MIVPGSLAQTQTHVAELAVEAVDGCECAEVMMLDDNHHLQTVSSTNVFASMAGVLQQHNGCGPSLTALSAGGCVVDDFATDQRWPRLAGWACSHGLASMCVCLLEDDAHVFGVLNLYSKRKDAFSAPVEKRCVDFAWQAAQAIQGVRLEAELSEVLVGQAILDQAVGVLMERYGISSERALARIVEASTMRYQHVDDRAPSEGSSTANTPERMDIHDTVRGSRNNSSSGGSTRQPLYRPSQAHS